MDDEITLHSPRLWESHYDGYLTVPEGTVYRAIDALRSHVAEWAAWVGDDPADHSSRARVANAAQALADLMDAMARRARQGGIRELVRQIQAFMSEYEARAYLDALRLELQHREEVLREAAHSSQQLQQLGWIHPDTQSAADRSDAEAKIAADLDVLDALIALHQTLQRREDEQMQQSERPVPPVSAPLAGPLAGGAEPERAAHPEPAAPLSEQEPHPEDEKGWEF